MLFCFSLGEKLGVIDPRLLYEQADTELLTLWAAHFAIKSERIHGPAEPTGPKVINHADVDVQVSNCERILMM